MITVGSTREERAATLAVLEGGVPFSFTGQAAFEGDGRVYEDGDGLRLTCEVEQYADSAAIEWTLWLENTGAADSRRVADWLPLDVLLPGSETVTVTALTGPVARIDDFSLRRDLLEDTLRYESTGSRQFVPFFHLDLGGRGWLVGLGWTHDWFLELTRQGDRLRLRAGMPHTDFYLHPGERVRSPRVMLMAWQGDEARSFNLLRRHLAAHHIPKDEQGEPYPPICLNTWGGMKTSSHLRLLEYVRQQGLEYDVYWIDAGWYGEDHETDEFQNLAVEDWFFYQGDWRVNRAIHPDTLKPVSDAAHALGMKLLLWYDMYNCIEGVGWQVTHPEWGALTGPYGPIGNHEPIMIAMLNVNHPEARQWLMDTLVASMKENGADCYREDPPPLYGGEDGPGRTGVCVMHAVEGLYAIWDRLRQEFPGMVIDNCGGGGSRIDLETLSRSYVLWRSDYNCHPAADPIGAQSGNIGLGHFVPLVNCAPPTHPGDDYTFRSGLYGGMGFGLFHVCGFDGAPTFPAPDYPIDWHRRKLQEYRQAKPLFAGDFYTLADCGTARDGWCAYEMTRPDLGRGMLLAFRRPECSQETVTLTPVWQGNTCILTDADTGEQFALQPGESLTLRVDRPAACRLLWMA